MTTRTKTHTMDSIDVDNDHDLDSFLDQVHTAGDNIRRRQIEEAIRLGIIDTKGNLLKDEVPEDMREDANRDFGG
ncbi:MAG TPA: hypothetical protein VK699_21640 [Terriglobales bacterium]|nr:hypothetical protein [Terriglobales bacterium]